MFKKILLFVFLFGLLFSQNILAVSNCNAGINSAGFSIDAGDFSPGGTKILDKVRDGGGDTTKSANIVLGLIIKNLIVVFGVFSVLMMTIGGGMMIFHSGQESLLTRGKGLFIWGIASLAIGLSAGLIVKLVTYFLY